jgi:hypothetical protein
MIDKKTLSESGGEDTTAFFVGKNAKKTGSAAIGRLILATSYRKSY